MEIITEISDKGGQTLFRKIIANNIYMLKKIYKHQPLLVWLEFLVKIKSDIINSLVEVFYIAYIISAIANRAPFSDILLVTIIFGSADLLNGLINAWYYNYFQPIKMLYLKKALQEEIFIKSVEIDLDSIYNPDFYEKYSRAQKEAEDRVFNVLTTVSDFVGKLFAVGTVLTIIFSIDPVITIPTVIIAAISIYFDLKNNQNEYLLDYHANAPLRKYEYVKRVHYIPEFAKELKISHVPVLLQKIFNSAYNEMVSVNKKYRKRIVLDSGFYRLIHELYFYGIYILVGFRFLTNYLLVGNFIAVINAGNDLRWRIIQLFEIVPKLSINSLYIDNYLELFRYKSRLLGFKRDITMEMLDNYDIEVDNVTFSYDGSKNVIKNVSLKIKTGERIALVGENGAGKTTLTNLINNLFLLNSGRIYIGGKDINNIKTDDLRRLICCVPQDFQLFVASVAENVLLRPVTCEEDEARVINALEKTGLYDKVRNLPDGIYTYLTKEFDQNGVVFSDGEKQKIALARIFASDSPIIIIDEPSSNLDPISENLLNESILQVDRSRTVIIISHRLTTTTKLDKIYYLEDGQIAEQGTHSELLNLNKKYAYLFYLQAKSYLNSGY